MKKKKNDVPEVPDKLCWKCLIMQYPREEINHSKLHHPVIPPLTIEKC